MGVIGTPGVPGFPGLPGQPGSPGRRGKGVQGYFWISLSTVNCRWSSYIGYKTHVVFFAISVPPIFHLLQVILVLLAQEVLLEKLDLKEKGVIQVFRALLET